MKKKQILLSGTMCLLFGSLSAQQFSEKLKEYPPSIVIKVYDVTQKAPLKVEDQLTLAQHFEKEEKAIAQAILLRSPKPKLDLVRKAYLEDFNTFLKKNNQLERYYTSRADSTIKLHKTDLLKKEGVLLQKSIYATVIDRKEILSLTQTQQDILHEKAVKYADNKSAFLATRPKDDFDKTINGDLKRILSEEQMRTYLTSKHSERATSWANEKWKELETHQLAGKYDSVASNNKIYKYLLERLVIRELMSDDLPKRDQILKSLSNDAPKELKELDIAKINKRKSQNKAKTSFAW